MRRVSGQVLRVLQLYGAPGKSKDSSFIFHAMWRGFMLITHLGRDKVILKDNFLCCVPLYCHCNWMKPGVRGRGK